MFLASDVSSILTCSTVVAPILFLGFLRFLSVSLQKKSESVINIKNQGVHMLKNTQFNGKSFAVSYLACFIETVWAFMVAVVVTVTGIGQGNLPLAKNIISHR